MFAVIAEFNTDENNRWVYDECIEEHKELPRSIYGPFDDMPSAEKFAENFMVDDTDVYDVYPTEEDFPQDYTINDPVEYAHLAAA